MSRLQHALQLLPGGIVALALSLLVQAQDFPTHPVRIVVPFPPSGNVDITARTVAPALGEALRQQVIVDNRAGAAGTIGSAAVAKSPPDGSQSLRSAARRSCRTCRRWTSSG